MIVSKKHTISVAHRIVGHDGKCRMLHGHNYEIEYFFTGSSEGDMVKDFGEIKENCCKVVDSLWDHRTIIWADDPLLESLTVAINRHETVGSVVSVPFNTTAENMARYLKELFHCSRVIVKEGPTTSAIAQ